MITLIVFGILIAVLVGYIACDQMTTRRQADQIITNSTNSRHYSAYEINRCITILQKRGKSLLGFGRWGSEQDNYRVQRLRGIRDNPGGEDRATIGQGANIILNRRTRANSPQ